MIKINGTLQTPELLVNKYPSGSIEEKIQNNLLNSKNMFEYKNPEQLKFEIDFRTKIIEASRELYKSKFSFRIFRKSICNEEFWTRTEEGGFKLKEGITPYAAINDIFANSKKYGNECATAMMIIYYRALSKILPEKTFNEIFADIHLMNWNFIDNDLKIRNYNSENDNIPGDCRYFKNPDVNPITPEWQGENVIDLGDDTYFGHGIGIANKEKMISSLNENRVDDATESAYLLDTASRPDYKHLSEIYMNSIENQRQ